MSTATERPPRADLTACPVTYADALSMDIGDPVGFRAITEEGPRCHAGCLAPGSSPHSHGTIVGWQIIGTAGILEVDTALMGVRASVVHPFDRGGDR